MKMTDKLVPPAAPTATSGVPAERPLAMTTREFALRHTVALLLNNTSTYCPYGSGAIVDIAGRWFVLTASHLFDVDDWKGRLVVASTRVQHAGDGFETGEALRIHFAGEHLLRHEPTDAAVFEVKPHDATTAALLPHVAVPATSIIAATNIDDPESWRSDSLLLCGFPSALASQLMEAEPMHGALLLDLSLLRGTRPLRTRERFPEAIFTIAEGVTDDAGAPIEAFSLQGASGGTLWATVDSGPCALVATHRGSEPQQEGWIACGTPLGIHLSMIAAEHGELAPFIREWWPGARYRF